MRTRGAPQNAALALCGDIASKGALLVVMVLAAHALSTPQFAALTAALAGASVLTGMLDMGSQVLITRDGVGGSAERGGLLRASLRARVPVLAALVLGAALVGVVEGDPAETLGAVLVAAVGALQLSLTGALRSAQDLGPEARAKLVAGVLTLGACAAAGLLAPRASTLLLAIAVAGALGLLPLLAALRRSVRWAPGPPAWRTLRRAAPLGAMGLATLAYYRSGPLVLALLSTPAQTARFGAASTVGFGMLCVANAATTGLLPRLSAASEAERARITRRALLWLTGFSVLLAAAIALAAGPLLALLFGARYGAAAGPLALLAGATVLIAPAGVLGTALIAAGRVRALGVQVAVSLAVNLAALVVLGPALGAWGAAAATALCEAVALALVARAALRALPGLWPTRAPTAPSLLLARQALR